MLCRGQKQGGLREPKESHHNESRHCGVIPSETPSPANFLPLAAGYPPEGAGRSGSGRGQRAEGASGTRSGRDPRTARQPRGTTTLAIAPTCIPERPGGAKGGGSAQIPSASPVSLTLNRAIWKYSTRPRPLR